MLKLFKTSSPYKLFDYDCVTLYVSLSETNFISNFGSIAQNFLRKDIGCAVILVFSTFTSGVKRLFLNTLLNIFEDIMYKTYGNVVFRDFILTLSLHTV